MNQPKSASTDEPTDLLPMKCSRRPRRVQLAVPGSNEKMIAKAAASRADHVFLDLEDAVAPKEKVASRARIVQALRTLDWGGKTRCVRINDLDTPWCYEDVIAVVEGAREQLDTILLPKANRPSDVQFLATLLTQIERKLELPKRIGIEVLIEEVEGLQNVAAIAHASNRLECLIFGMGDYSASHGVDPRALREEGFYPGDLWYFARFAVVMAARAAGLDAVDGPYANFVSERGYADECRKALALGCVGKWAIHPSQIPIALEIFTPDPSEVARAREMVAGYAAAAAQGLGSVNVGGMMVDAATIRILRNVLARAELYGM